MGYNNRPLPSPTDETDLKLMEITIVQEWSRISLRLRLCLKHLGTRGDPFRLKNRQQIEFWHTELQKRLQGTASEKKLEDTAQQLWLMLDCRNAISHGECRWTREDDSYRLWYTSANPAHITLSKRKKIGKPPALPVFNGIDLMPEDSRTDSYSFSDMRKHAHKIADLTQSVVELSEEVLTSVQVPSPRPKPEN